jgi:hypothetical protein
MDIGKSNYLFLIFSEARMVVAITLVVVVVVVVVVVINVFEVLIWRQRIEVSAKHLPLSTRSLRNVYFL